MLYMRIPFVKSFEQYNQSVNRCVLNKKNTMNKPAIVIIAFVLIGIAGCSRTNEPLGTIDDQSEVIHYALDTEFQMH